jgi:hypothetical protein
LGPGDTAEAFINALAENCSLIIITGARQAYPPRLLWSGRADRPGLLQAAAEILAQGKRVKLGLEAGHFPGLWALKTTGLLSENWAGSAAPQTPLVITSGNAVFRLYRVPANQPVRSVRRAPFAGGADILGLGSVVFLPPTSATGRAYSLLSPSVPEFLDIPEWGMDGAREEEEAA